MLNWRIKPFLCVIAALQLVMLGLAGLAALGFDAPAIRQIVGFLYLTFVPGLLILRILRLHKLGAIETLLYSVGLSLAFVMLLGLFVNTVYPFVGISGPISILPLLVTLAVAVAVLSIVVCIRERRSGLVYSDHCSMKCSDIFLPPVLLLLLLPLLSILGASLVNYYQNNIVMLILIGLIALVAALVAFNRFVPQRLYPLALVMIALSLLWHWSLISQYITGWDIHTEYYYQNLVLTNSFWDSSLYSSVNNMLSITMLAPIYSLLLNMDTIWLFKIVYPLLYSLVPLALFQIFRKQTDDKVAFFAVFFFISFWVFFGEMTNLARQQIAELFLALSILLLLSDDMVALQRRLLLIFFGFSIVVSHYGLTYFYMFYLIIAFILLNLARSNTLVKIWGKLTGKFSKSHGTAGPPAGSTGILRTAGTLNIGFVMLIVVFGLAWYIYNTSGSTFIAVIRIGEQIASNMTEFFNPEAMEPYILLATGLARPEVISTQRNVFLIIQYIIQFSIVAGVAYMLLNIQKAKFQSVYIAFTIGSAVLLLTSVVLPYFAGFFNMDRIYHLSLFFLAPFCVLGVITVFRWLFRLVPLKAFRILNNGLFLRLAVILILIPYFLFTTGFIIEVTGDVSTSIALDPDMAYPRFNEQEVAGKTWLSSNTGTSEQIYCAGDLIVFLLNGDFHWGYREFFGETTQIPDDVCIYLDSLNVKRGEIKKSPEEPTEYIKLQSSSFSEEVLAHRNKIYNNGGAQVYR